MSVIEEIKKELGSPRLIIGSEEVLKALRNGSIQKIFLATNPADKVKADIDHYAGLSKVEVVDTNVSNEELGTLCKKPFSISVLGLRSQ